MLAVIESATKYPAVKVVAVRIAALMFASPLARAQKAPRLAVLILANDGDWVSISEVWRPDWGTSGSA